jgi:hypothetical protein
MATPAKKKAARTSGSAHQKSPLAAAASAPQKSPAGDGPPKPECRVHQVPMKAYKTGESKIYFACPVDGCREKESRFRPVGPLKNRYGYGDSAGGIKPKAKG